jgi:hypothetical protein
MTVDDDWHNDPALLRQEVAMLREQLREAMDALEALAPQATVYNKHMPVVVEREFLDALVKRLERQHRQLWAGAFINLVLVALLTIAVVPRVLP